MPASRVPGFGATAVRPPRDLRAASSRSAAAIQFSGYDPSRPFQPVEPPGGSPREAEHDPNRPFQPIQPPGGSPRLPEHDPNRPFQPVRPDETPVVEAAPGTTVRHQSGARVENPRVTARALDGHLQTRIANNNASISELEAENARDPMSPEYHRREAEIARLRAEVPRLESARRDAALAGQDDQRGMARLQTIADGHGVPWQPLRNGQQVDTGTTTVRTSSRGGLDHSVESESVRAPAAGAEGGASPVERTTDRRSIQTGFGDGRVARTYAQSQSVARSDGSGESRSRQTSIGAGRVEGGHGVSVNGERSDTVNHQAGGSETNQASRGASLGYGDGNVTGQRTRGSQHTVTAADGSSVSNQSSQTNRVAIGRGGITGRQESSEVHEERDAAGEVTRRSADTSNASGGLTMGQHQVGAQAGVGGTRERRDGTNTSSLGGQADASISNRGGSASGTGQGSIGRGRTQLSGSVGASASFTTDIQEVEGSDGQQYEVVTVLTLSGNLGVNGRVGSDTNNVSVGVEGRRSHAMTFRHRLSAAQAASYRASLAQVRDNQVPVQGIGAEFAYMRRSLEMERGHTGLGRESIVSDPAAARNLADGDSMEITDTSGSTRRIGVQGGGGGVSAGASHSEGSSETRTIRVRATTVGGHSVREITLTFSRTDESQNSANASVEGMGVAGARGHSDTHGRSVVFSLPADARDYDARFARIMGCHDAGSAEHLALELGADITRSEEHTTDTSGGVGATRDGAVNHGLNQREVRSTTSDVTVGRDEDGHGTIVGSTGARSESQLGVRVGGTDRVSSNVTGTAQNRFDSTRARGDRQEVSVDQNRDSGVRVGSDEGVVGDLRRRLGLLRRELEGYRVSEGEVNIIAERARGGAWMDALPLYLRNGNHESVVGLWRALQSELRNPRPRAEWVAADPDMAMQIARGEAITRFRGAAPPEDGFAAIQGLLRGGGGQALGVHFEWPDSIRARQPEYNRLHEEMLGLEGRWRGLSDAERRTRVGADGARVTAGLRAVLNAIRAAEDFHSPEAAAETEEAVQADIRRVDELVRRHANDMEFSAEEANAAADAPAPAPAPAGAAPAPAAASHPAPRGRGASGRAASPTPAPAPLPTPGQEPQAPPPTQTGNEPEGPTPEDRERAIAETREIVPRLESMHHREAQILAEVEAQVGTWHLTNGWIEEALGRLDTISQLMPVWRRAAERLYTLFRDNHGDMSAYPRQYLPNLSRRLQLLQRLTNEVPEFRRGTLVNRAATYRAETPVIP
ncbi:MAG: proline-rich domain-containing protein [Myxococcota bacterium]